MPTLENDFKGQLKYENLQFFFRRHWVRYLQPIFFSIPIGILILIVLFLLSQLTLIVDLFFIRVTFVLFSMTVLIVFINTFFLQILNFYFDMVIVTDCRVLVIRKTLFLKNDSDAIDLTKIQDIAVESHGIMRNYLGYGKMIITLSTSAPPILISFVPNPHFYLEWANRVKREHIIQRQDRNKNLNQVRYSPYLQDYADLNSQL